jgi:predicted anti-sigma-YlaC factor YlaD
MDAEPLGVSATALDQHLASCPDCAGWVQQATSLTRSLRLSAAGVPDLTEKIMADAVLPVRRVLRRRLALRLGLGIVGLVQLGLAIPEIGGENVGMQMSVHGSHEAAAWNLAIAIAFFLAALRPRRASGLIAILGAFIGVLLILGIRDFVAGAVTADRLATHLAATVGLALLVLIDRAERALPPGASAGADTAAHAARDERGVRGVA